MIRLVAPGLRAAGCQGGGHHLGSPAAAEVIAHMGARPEVKLTELAKKQGFL